MDSRASHSICSGGLYRRLLKNKGERGAKSLVARTDGRNLLSADQSIMPVLATFDTEIKINGLAIPITFDVVETLGYDCLIGMTFLEATEANIDLKSNTLSLYGGLISVPMTRSGHTNTVYTLTDITIPPYCESVFPVSTFAKPSKETYIIEGNFRSPCRAILVARALVNANKKKFPCRVLNPTAKAITLRAHTPVGELDCVTIATVSG